MGEFLETTTIGIAIVSTLYVLVVNYVMTPYIRSEDEYRKFATINGMYALSIIAVLITATITKLAH